MTVYPKFIGWMATTYRWDHPQGNFFRHPLGVWGGSSPVENGGCKKSREKVTPKNRATLANTSIRDRGRRENRAKRRDRHLGKNPAWFKAG
jgi:hypothetical protein